jgi:hypothetical protein
MHTFEIFVSDSHAPPEITTATVKHAAEIVKHSKKSQSIRNCHRRIILASKDAFYSAV